MKISPNVQQILNISYQNAKENEHEFICPEHILYVSLFFEQVQNLLKECHVKVNKILTILDGFFSNHMPLVKAKDPIQSEQFRMVLAKAIGYSEDNEDSILDIDQLLLALLDSNEHSYAAYALRLGGLEKENLLGLIEEKNRFKKQGFFLQAKEFQQFFTDYSEKAQQGQFSPFVAQDRLLSEIVQILLRKNKNNPFIVGDGGVGKTHLVQGLAQWLWTKEGQKLFPGYTLYALDVAAVMGSSRYRTDLEEKLKMIFHSMSEKGKIIIFLDDAHSMISNTNTAFSIDFPNVLKPFLFHSNLAFIGACSFENFKKSIEKNNSLNNYFTKITLSPPSKKQTFQILKSHIHHYEQYHHVRYSKSLLENIIDLTGKNNTERCLPDTAIDLLDQLGAYSSLKRTEALAFPDTIHFFNQPQFQAPEQESFEPKKAYVLKQADLWSLVNQSNVSQTSGIQGSPKLQLQQLEQKLIDKIYGQDQAIQSIVSTIKRSYAGFKKENKPVANLFFIGSTGVGKTELAIQLAKALNIGFFRFDMSEYQEKHSVSRLIGSPPGYIGHDDGGLLVDTVKKNPHSVLLFDEIEKAHPDINNTFLQMMDSASLTDGLGRKANLQNNIIIFTSNAGSEQAKQLMIGFGKQARYVGDFDQAVEKAFSPEFINRIDKVLIFNDLDKDIIYKITEREIDVFKKQLLQSKIQLDIDSEVLTWLGEKGYSAKYGARHLARFVDKHLKDLFVDIVLFESSSSPKTIHAYLQDDQIQIHVKN